MITLCEIFTFMLRIQRKHSDESFFAKTLSLTVNSYNELLMKWSMEKNHYCGQLLTCNICLKTGQSCDVRYANCSERGRLQEMFHSEINFYFETGCNSANITCHNFV